MERKALERIYRAAIAAVEPGAAVARALVVEKDGPRIRAGSRTLARLDRGRVRLLAVGKAAPAMARAALAILGPRIDRGLVVAPAGVTVDMPGRVEVQLAEHPLPGRGSVAAGRKAWRLVDGLDEDDTVLLLLSGGASSLLALPASGIALADKIATTRLLLASGASIAELNAVRKHLSRTKGGGLARRALPARFVTLALSDVIGSSSAVIGSGPAAADPTTFADALAVLARRGLLARVPRSVRRHFERGRSGEIAETAKPGELRARRVVVGDVGLALAGAAREAASLGFVPRIWTASLRGEARRAAVRVAAQAGRPSAKRGVCLLAGGETTVTVTGDGRGGRNQELALALARQFEGRRGIAALAAGSDGIDGPTDAAGAFVDGSTLARARRIGIRADQALARNDSYGFFHRLGDLFRPGPTGTNVMDLTIVLVDRARKRAARRLSLAR